MRRSRTTLPSASAARQLRALADRSGTGNVADLLREGVRYAGGPSSLGRDAEYASNQTGTVVTIVETAWSDAGSTGTSDALDTEADSALALNLPAAG